MAHPRNMPKQDLKAQYYSRRRSSITTSSSLPPTPGSSSQPQPSSSSQGSIFNERLMDSTVDETIDALLERSKIILQDWEVKKGTPTPTPTPKIRTDVYPEVKKVAPAPTTTPSPTPTPKLRTKEGYYRDWDGKVKPVAVVEMPNPEEVEEVMEKSENTVRERFSTVVEDDAAEKEEKDEVGRRIEGLDIINMSLQAPPVPVALQPIQEESSTFPSSSPPPPEPSRSLPAVPSPSAYPPVKKPKPAANTTVKVSAPPAVPKEWKPKHKIHDWFCASHKASTSTLDPYKCIRCTKRRAASKSSLKK